MNIDISTKVRPSSSLASWADVTAHFADTSDLRPSVLLEKGASSTLQ